MGRHCYRWKRTAAVGRISPSGATAGRSGIGATPAGVIAGRRVGERGPGFGRAFSLGIDLVEMHAWDRASRAVAGGSGSGVAVS
jgi:hypothetical protein